MSAGFRRLAWLTVKAAMSAAVTRGQVRLAGDAQAGDQHPGEPRVTAHRHRRQPALAAQVAAELRQQRLSRRRGHGSGLRDHAQAPQVAQQRDKGPAAAAPGTPPPGGPPGSR